MSGPHTHESSCAPFVQRPKIILVKGRFLAPCVGVILIDPNLQNRSQEKEAEKKKKKKLRKWQV